MNPSPSILVLSGVRGDTRRYRTVHPYEQLRLLGVDAELSHISDPHLRRKAHRAGVVIIHRSPWDRQVAWLVSEIGRRQGLLIQDTDDLIFDPAIFRYIDSPDFADPVRAALYQEDLRRNRRTLDACHAVTASTEFLAGHVRTLGKPAWVHRNAFSIEMLALSETAYRQRHPGDSIVIGYASGTPTHNRDFALARPALQAIMQRYPQTELHLLGSLDPGDGWGELASHIVCHARVPWRQLPGLMASFDINLAPLRGDNPFGQSKSEIKYVEAALLRLPTVASPTAAFQSAIRSGENGFLAADEDWYAPLEALVVNAELRQKIGRLAYQHVMRYYHPRVRAEELAATLQAISQAVREKRLWPELPGAPEESALAHYQTPAQHERSPSLLRLGWHNLCARGPRTLLLQGWVFFRRLLAPIVPYRRHD
ncbi:MAG: glycosyltransferase family 4 protein [Chloroflexota bacterium]